MPRWTTDRTYGARRIWRDVLADGVAPQSAPDRAADAPAGPAGAATACRLLAERTYSDVRFGCAPCKGGAFQWVQAPPGKSLQPEATGAVMEVTKWLKPSVSVSRIGDSASVQAVTRALGFLVLDTMARASRR